jgi:hypothetical protein
MYNVDYSVHYLSAPLLATLWTSLLTTLLTTGCPISNETLHGLVCKSVKHEAGNLKIMYSMPNSLFYNSLKVKNLQK